MSAYNPNGRLGNTSMELQTDPRIHPDLAKVLQPMGLGKRLEGKFYGTDLAELEPVIAASHAMATTLYDALPNELPEDKDEAEIERKTVSIDGLDGNKVKLHFFRLANATGLLPAVAYIHGGGMTCIDTLNKVHVRWCTDLAQKGVIAIAVDFRNSWTEGCHNPFPAGLNDCAAAIKYLHSHSAELGISKIVVQGESGGGNLTLATALRANAEGWIDAIAGVYASVPFISGAYGLSDEKKLSLELSSLVECEGYFLGLPTLAATHTWYTPSEADQKNPLAWPYYASRKDLEGLPPHVLHMDELDPLRDEGVAYFRKLVAAGVPATAEISLGIPHASSLIFRQALPELHKTAVGKIVAFVKRFVELDDSASLASRLKSAL